MKIKIILQNCWMKLRRLSWLLALERLADLESTSEKTAQNIVKYCEIFFCLH